MKIIFLSMFLLLPGMALASASVESSRSLGKFISDDSLLLKQEIVKQPIMTSFQKADNPSSQVGLVQYRTALHESGTEFEIFDAWVDLNGDLDDDGYFHHIKVSFDADTTSELETVFVKLYLSREGGPWYQYADTDLFEIHFDSTDDSYEVLTELVDGYRPGYYEVLIELHSLYHHGTVASQIIRMDSEGYSLSLEDLEHDDVYRDEYYDDTDYIDVSYGVGVSGSFSYAGLVMLAILLLIKLRYFSGSEIKHSRVTQKKMGEVLCNPGTRGETIYPDAN
jgi:hypothetical protein